jgi:hypothetical protein
MYPANTGWKVPKPSNQYFLIPIAFSVAFFSQNTGAGLFPVVIFGGTDQDIRHIHFPECIVIIYSGL